MAEPRWCAICGRHFQPDARSRTHQRTCSRRCRKKAKRERDRIHKQRYRETGLGGEQRRRESGRRRERIGWAEYMRFWRKADSPRTARKERARARRYYEGHREEILRKRREKRSARRAAKTAWSH